MSAPAKGLAFVGASIPVELRAQIDAIGTALGHTRSEVITSLLQVGLATVVEVYDQGRDDVLNGGGLFANPYRDGETT